MSDRELLRLMWAEEKTCPGMPGIGWPLHSVDSDEELYEGRCYDCATALGIATGDELAAGRER